MIELFEVLRARGDSRPWRRRGVLLDPSLAAGSHRPPSPLRGYGGQAVRDTAEFRAVKARVSNDAASAQDASGVGAGLRTRLDTTALRLRTCRSSSPNFHTSI